MTDFAAVHPYVQAVVDRLIAEELQALPKPRDPREVRREVTPVPAYSTDGGSEL